MVLSDFLSRQNHDDSSPLEMVPISFNMYSIGENRKIFGIWYSTIMAAKIFTA